MKTETKVLIGLGTALTGGLVYLIAKKKKDDDSNNDTDSKAIDSYKGGQALEAKSIFPLRKGSRGTAVKKLQIALNKHRGILPQIKVDGIFGTNTQLRLLALFKNTEVSEKMYKEKIIGV